MAGRNAALAVLALGAFALGLYVNSRVNDGDAANAVASAPANAAAAPQAPPLEIRGYVLPEPEAIEPFSLVDDSGQPFGREALAGGWSFLYFGYTYCPDICPLTLVEVANLRRQLRIRCDGLDARYYLVSVDPQRDTPERLREYVRYFDRDFHGVTGRAAEIDKLVKKVGAFYELPADRSNDAYLVGHSSTVTVIDPEGKLHAVFTMPHTGENMADDFAAVHERYRERHAGYEAACKL
jgi:protein SCO1/2